MNRISTAHGRAKRRRVGAIGLMAYGLVCSGILLSGAAFALRGFNWKLAETPTQIAQSGDIPVATIQLPLRDGNLCQRLLFHNNSGRYEDGGTAECEDESAPDTPGSSKWKHSESVLQAFRSRW